MNATYQLSLIGSAKLTGSIWCKVFRNNIVIVSVKAATREQAVKEAVRQVRIARKCW